MVAREKPAKSSLNVGKGVRTKTINTFKVYIESIEIDILLSFQSDLALDFILGGVTRSLPVLMTRDVDAYSQSGSALRYIRTEYRILRCF